MDLFRSCTSGYWILPMPPFSTGVFFHARWVNLESTETPITSQFFFLKSSILLLKGEDFRRAYEGEIKGIEEQDDISSPEG